MRVADETRRLLEKLKNERNLDSYDQVIRWLVAAAAGQPRSMYGASKGALRLERETEDGHRP